MKNHSVTKEQIYFEIDEVKKLLNSGDLPKAAKIVNRLLDEYPNSSTLILLAAKLEMQMENFQQALNLINTSIQKNKKIPNEQIYLYQGIIHRALNMRKKAMESYQKSIEIKASSQAFSNLGILFLEINRLKNAEQNFDAAIKLDPSYSPAYQHRASIFVIIGHYDKAIDYFKKAIDLAPKNTGALIGLGSLLGQLGKDKDALACFDHAITISNNNANAYFFKAETLLKMGNYIEGWELFEWRWKTKYKKNEVLTEYPNLTLDNSVSNKTVLVYSEGGLGDNIMFARYLHLLEALGAKVIAVIPDSLITIFKETFNFYKIIPCGQIPPKTDFQCSMMSLPKIFKTSIENIPQETPYIKIPQESLNVWDKKLGKSPQLRVGIIWSGKIGRRIDSSPLRNRSISLDLFTPLFDLPIELHSLQKEISSHDINFLLSRPSIYRHHNDLHDFSDTGAVMSQMDLIISIDTSAAHLAGALGKPLWLLLPEAHDYRWMTINEKNLWYPSISIFKKTNGITWDDIIYRIAKKLKSDFNL